MVVREGVGVRPFGFGREEERTRGREDELSLVRSLIQIIALDRGRPATSD